MEGIASCLIAVVAFIVLIGFPDQGIIPSRLQENEKEGIPQLIVFIALALKPGLISRRPFLTKEEVSIVLVRIAKDRGDAIAEQLTLKRIFHYLGDWKIWEFALLICCNVRCSSGQADPSANLTAEYVHLLLLFLPPSDPQGIAWLLAWEDLRSHTPSILSRSRCKLLTPRESGFTR